MKCVCIDCARLCDRDTAHDCLAQALDFPAWYGRNLDALFDMLTGETGPLRLELANPEALTTPYGEKVLAAMRDAAAVTPELEIAIV